MADELKSAWELALEKLEGQEDMAVAKLSEEQKQAITQIRSNYQARIAEEEIGTQSHIKEALISGAFDEVEKMNQRLVSEKQRLYGKMEKEIEEIRNSEDL